jgi:hypothetical protein
VVAWTLKVVADRSGIGRASVTFHQHDEQARRLSTSRGQRRAGTPNANSKFIVPTRRLTMSLTLLLAIFLILLLVGALPTWPYSGSWGYYPSGVVGLLLIVLLVMMLTGRL